MNNDSQLRVNTRGNTGSSSTTCNTNNNTNTVNKKITAKWKVDLRSYASLNVTLGTAKSP